jgi:hypothetical protein
MDSVVVTAAMLEPVMDSITGNLGVLLPVGLTILAVMVGVALIPRIIWKFSKPLKGPDYSGSF